MSGLTQGYIFMSYIMSESVQVISDSDFTPSKPLKTRYSIDKRAQKRKERKKKLDRIFNGPKETYRETE